MERLFEIIYYSECEARIRYEELEDYLIKNYKNLSKEEINLIDEQLENYE